MISRTCGSVPTVIVPMVVGTHGLFLGLLKDDFHVIAREEMHSLCVPKLLARVIAFWALSQATPSILTLTHTSAQLSELCRCWCGKTASSLTSKNKST